MKVTTDACLFGGWTAEEVKSQNPIAIGSNAKSVLDIGTGTGLLAFMFAQKNSEAIIDGIEIDDNASKQAMENVEASPWKQRINIINADAKTFRFPNKYDLIITNPPFYEKEIRSETENKNIAHHSEELKLGELLTILKNNLDPEGEFFLLLPYKRNEEIRKFFKAHQLHMAKLLLVRPSVKHDYFRIMIKGKLNEQANEEMEFDEMSIWDENQHYTNEFVKLLKDYYLYL